MNDGVDDEIEVSAFGSFCFVLFGFIWGCRKQLCWDLCTVHKDFLMHHNRFLERGVSHLPSLSNFFFIQTIT